MLPLENRACNPQRQPAVAIWGCHLGLISMSEKAAAAALACGNAACGKALAPPLLQCSKCKGEAYCCKACQVPPPPRAARGARADPPLPVSTPPPPPLVLACRGGRQTSSLVTPVSSPRSTVATLVTARCCCLLSSSHICLPLVSSCYRAHCRRDRGVVDPMFSLERSHLVSHPCHQNFFISPMILGHEGHIYWQPYSTLSLSKSVRWS